MFVLVKYISETISAHDLTYTVKKWSLQFRTAVKNGHWKWTVMQSVSFSLLTAETMKKIDNQSSWNL